MQFKHFLGFDLSKDTLDFVLRDSEHTLWKGVVKNTSSEVKSLFKTLSTTFQINFKECLVCMEATGLYDFHLLSYTTSVKIPSWVAHALSIKQSLGMTRGKSDPVDAGRIAEYACRFQDKAVLWSPPRAIIVELRALIGCRERFISARILLENPLAEMKEFSSKTLYTTVDKSCGKVVKQLKKNIKEIELKILALIKKDKDLYEMYIRLDSIQGVGPVTSAAFIAETNEFKDFANGKKLACHSGVAPFSNSSGKSKGKAHISHKANKKLKTLLDLCARSAILAKGNSRIIIKEK